ncbi:MAG: ECF-type sigma factor [Planctomycetota bacterium]|jgi:RNA polymerase sigma factor (TIGR02999 family)
MADDVTRILGAIERGDAGASERLLPLVYDELRALAESRLLRERAGQSLQATALVHEAYLRLVGPEDAMPAHWDGRGHFFAAAAEAMRRILIDRARARAALKRGGDARRLALDPAALTLDDASPELLDLDEAIGRLAAEDPAKAELVKLRFFAGLTLRQAAAVLEISPTTADRYWAYARAWLYDALGGGD